LVGSILSVSGPEVPKQILCLRSRYRPGVCQICGMKDLQVQGKVVLKKGREQSLLRFHPWIFSGAIDKLTPDLPDGSWVAVEDFSGNTIGFGHWQKGSISVRMVLFGRDFYSDIYKQKVAEAIRFRKSISLPDAQTNAWRLIHAEGDGLPGLIVDIYDRVAVVQAHDAGMSADKDHIAEAVRLNLGDSITAIFFRDTNADSGHYIYGAAAAPAEVSEHGNKFLIDWEHGQKTGFFLDQRENRALLSTFARGRKVLNTFSFSGGFSVYALKGGAELVHSVDASSSAISLCVQNIRLNGFDPDVHRCYEEDTFDFLRSSESIYDLIVLDPPAFAKHKDARHQAMKGYQRLNAEAMKVIAPNGVLFTFSCSQVVDRQLFYDTVMSSAIQAGRQARVIAHLSQPADHPVSAFHPEGAYLKGLILHIS